MSTEIKSTEINVLDLPVQISAAALRNTAFVGYDKDTGEPISFDSQKFLRAEYKDLSMYDIYGASLLGRSTANCYVVRTAGAYRFPLVYGNALKGGNANVVAYDGFVNHLGNAITSPFIEANANCMPVSAEICWMDQADLLVNLEIVEGGDCKYIQFEVNNVPITGANAQVAVKDASGNIMWSWHIWVTSEDLTPVQITNDTPKVYEILPVNLGWTWDSPDRLRGKSPHYQWGRKDPFVPPAAYNSGNNKTTYGQRSFTTENSETAATTIADSIKRPFSFFFGTSNNSYTWEPSGRLDLWCARNTSTGVSDNVVVKTIYDPCPVGFSVPNARIYTGFTAGGGNTSDPTLFNVVGSFTAGWFFKRNSEDTVGTFFPASGYRSGGSGGLAGVGGGGYYWCAIPSSATHGRDLDFGSGGVCPQGASDRAYGFSVRPARELN